MSWLETIPLIFKPSVVLQQKACSVLMLQAL